MKRSFVTLVLAGLLVSCGAGDERVDPPAASGPSGASTSTSLSTTTSATTTPAPTTSAITATTTSTTTTTAAPRSRAAVAPGEVLVIDEQLSEADRPFRSSDTDVVEAWLVLGTPQEREPQTSAWLGDATVSRDGRLTLRASVPVAMATRTTDFGTAVAESTHRGDYRLVLGNPLGTPTSLTVRVTADAPPLQLPTTRPAPIAVTRQVLGDDNLAGVVFGTSDTEAERSLVARFGPPGATTEWHDGCVGQYRWLRWGPLVVEFQRPETDAAGRFDSYSYQTAARDWPPMADPTMPATVTGLGTAQNITLGSTVADLRGATDDPVEIRTGYLDVLGERWVRRDGEVVAELDRDFLRPDAKVERISAPRSTSLIIC